MSDVFLSYAHADRERIDLLARALEDEALQVFWDRDEIEMTRSAVRLIDEEIRQSGVVLLILTQAATTSRFLLEEANLASSLGTLLPVKLDAVEGSRQLSRMSSIQNLDLVGWNGDKSDKRFGFLVEEIKRRLRDRQSRSEIESYPSVPPFLTRQAPSSPPIEPAPAPAPEPISAPQPGPPPTQVAPPPQDVTPPVAPAARSPVASAGPPAMQTPDVFVAYSRKDSETCRKIVTELRSQGLNVFYDQYIQGGEEWRDMLAWNIKNCSVLVVLFTANSVASPQVRKEVNLATSHSKSIIPMMIENVSLDGGLELELNGINFIPYFDNPTQRLGEAVEKAKTLAAISAFDRRQQGFPEASTRQFMPVAAPAQAIAPSTSKRGVVLGTCAVGGGMMLAASTAYLTATFSGRGNPEFIAALATGIFFVAFPYVISILLLFGRLLRSH